LKPLEGKRIGVVGCDRPSWDARALARAWGNEFTVLHVTVIRHADERVLPDADLAARHDDEARLGWLAERLRAALSAAVSRPDALVVPPWLGVGCARAAALSRLVGMPCGEAVGGPGGSSGLRFEQARERALAAAAADRVHAWVTKVLRRPQGWSVAFGDDVLDADSLVLALGGLIGGGIEYAPSEAIFSTALPPYPRRPFRLSLDAPLTIGARGRRLAVPGSLFGVAPETLAWPFTGETLIDCVGVLAGPDGRVAPGLFVAGDLRADRPRTWLDALATGAIAGAAAACGAAT
ncbi:MAG: hypothetical protein M3O50_09455, partial [Myxococcota bacterium]|nr:hypothetical protein [Myxococcota bacterium]